jgi:4-amino-4-deoxychorismate lyase
MWMMMNGQLIRDQEAMVSVYDHGYMYGVGLFETLRVYNRIPYLLVEHLQRLTESCKALQIEWMNTAQEIRAQLAQLLDANELEHAYVRITISAGTAPLGLPDRSYTNPNVLIYMKPLSEMLTFAKRPTKNLQILKLRRNLPEDVQRYKSAHYLNNILGKQECLQYPWAQDAEGLFLTQEQYLAEGVVSNLFFVKSGKLFTPSIETGILAGITRQWVIEQAELLGFEVEQGLYALDDLQNADEVFITNSVQELVAVNKIFLHSGEFTSFNIGPICTTLAQHYEQLRRGMCNET